MSRYRDPFDLARHIAGRTDPIITRYLHSAVIISRRGDVIGTGVNHFRGRNVFVESENNWLDKTVHAEVHALSKVNIRWLSDAVVISYARTNVASILARPCPNCWEMLKHLGFRKVFYSTRSELDKPVWREEKF